MSKYNSFYKAIRILAYVERSVSKLKKELKDFPRYVTASERADSTTILLQQEQRKAYSEDIKTVEISLQMKNDRKILKIYPFLYNDVFCVGGRLAHANLPDKNKYQRLFPQSSHLARLVVSEAHLSTHLGGTTQVMAHICTAFWVTSCRSFVGKFVLNCVGCSQFIVKH